MILNGLKGTLDLIDEEAYELIKAHEDDEELPGEVLDLISDFKDEYLNRGYLTSLGSDEEIVDARRQAKEMIESRNEDNWGVVLVPNLGCNYRCTYCFEKNGGYPELTMTKKQVDSIFEIIKYSITHEDELTLYGGEPLDRNNRELIEYIVKKGSEIGKSFFVVTNGHDLDYYIDLLGDDKIKSLQITLDGPREIHNCRRIALDKDSSYDKIIKNIKTAISKSDVQILLRINVDKRNLPYIVELFENLDEQKILYNPNVSVSVNSVVGEDDVLLTHKELSELESSIEKQFPGLRGKYMSFERASNGKIMPALMFGEPVKCNAVSCGAVGGMKVFTPDWKIYSCWSSIGYPEHVIGTYDMHGKTIWNNAVLDRWKRKTVVFDKKCYSCKYVFLCSGGCKRPKLPNEARANAIECDYYQNMFVDYLALVTDEYMAVMNR